ncbi:hypothetical protein [Allobacillus saliphilus]|uniref:hypothetical protein n=1 Tax=Allobacillus saliphilus TaxID=2912308 RepID=UPI001BA878FE|nr:hypothetical protein [Allobacillus saliphilus]
MEKEINRIVLISDIQFSNSVDCVTYISSQMSFENGIDIKTSQEKGLSQAGGHFIIRRQKTPSSKTRQRFRWEMNAEI